MAANGPRHSLRVAIVRTEERRPATLMRASRAGKFPGKSCSAPDALSGSRVESSARPLTITHSMLALCSAACKALRCASTALARGLRALTPPPRSSATGNYVMAFIRIARARTGALAE